MMICSGIGIIGAAPFSLIDGTMDRLERPTLFAAFEAG
jgi:hypothetical protein